MTPDCWYCPQATVVGLSVVGVTPVIAACPAHTDRAVAYVTRVAMRIAYRLAGRSLEASA